MARILAILITLAVVAQSAIGGLHGTLVMCIGAQGTTTASSAESQCGHNHTTPIQAPSQEHDDDCCGDVQVTLARLLTLPRSSDSSVDVPMPAPLDAWIVLAVDTGLAWRGPPERCGLDPSRDQHLAIVSCTRLTL